MTIISTTELDLKGDRSLQVTLEAGITAKRTFIVQTDDPSHTEPDILTATGIPIGLELFPGSADARCHSYSAERIWNDRLKWKVVAEYKSIFNKAEIQRSQNPSPLDRSTVVTGQSRTIMMPVRRCLRCDAYRLWDDSFEFKLVSPANSASDPLDPPIHVPFVEWEWHFAKNLTSFPDWAKTASYQNGVNDADQEFEDDLGNTITLEKGCAKIGNVKPSGLKKENSVDYFTLEWDVAYRRPRELISGETVAPGPWDEERLDEGMRKRVESGGETVWENIRDKSEQSLMLPVPFGGDGLPIGSPGVAIPEADLLWYCYRPFGPRVDYSVIQWT